MVDITDLRDAHFSEIVDSRVYFIISILTFFFGSSQVWIEDLLSES